MEVVRVRAFRQHQPLRRGFYAMSHVGSSAFDSLIVAVDTDEGVTGWGEMAVLSAVYGDAFAAGARAGVAELAPILLGSDPTQPRSVSATLDEAMRGQPYVKSALDMACWDATARAAGRPLCESLGARHGEAVRLYNVVTISSSDDAVALARELVSEGYRRLQVKVGTVPEDDAERLTAVRDAVGPDMRRQHRKVVVFRPLFAVGGQDLGYLPGNESEKMQPWAQAVFDTLGALTSSDVIEEVVDRGMLEVLPLTHIRGRSLHDAFVVVDEAQSLERNVLLTVLSRIGSNSRVVLTHDVGQRDNLRVGRHDGVVAVVEKLKGHPLFAHVTLTRSERSPIAALVTEMLENLVL